LPCRQEPGILTLRYDAGATGSRCNLRLPPARGPGTARPTPQRSILSILGIASCSTEEELTPRFLKDDMERLGVVIHPRPGCCVRLSDTDGTQLQASDNQHPSRAMSMRRCVRSQGIPKCSIDTIYLKVPLSFNSATVYYPRQDSSQLINPSRGRILPPHLPKFVAPSRLGRLAQ